MAYLVRHTTTNWAEIMTALATLEAERISVPSYQNWDRVTMSIPHYARISTSNILGKLIKDSGVL